MFTCAILWAFFHVIGINLCAVLLFQVHGLDPETWKKVDVVYIDIADRTQVEPKVNMRSLRSVFHPRRPRHLIRVLFIVDFPVSHQDYKPEEDPCRYKSVKTGRGPLGPDWKVQRFIGDVLVGWDTFEATEIYDKHRPPTILLFTISISVDDKKCWSTW